MDAGGIFHFAVSEILPSDVPQGSNSAPRPRQTDRPDCHRQPRHHSWPELGQDRWKAASRRRRAPAEFSVEHSRSRDVRWKLVRAGHDGPRGWAEELARPAPSILSTASAPRLTEWLVKKLRSSSRSWPGRRSRVTVCRPGRRSFHPASRPLHFGPSTVRRQTRSADSLPPPRPAVRRHGTRRSAAAVGLPPSRDRARVCHDICTRPTGTPSSSAAACSNSARAPWPAFDLARHHRDGSVGAEVNASRDVLRAAAKEAVAAALAAFLFLRQAGENSDQ